MTNLQLIESLCSLVEEEATLIRSLYTQLAELTEVSEASRSAVEGIEKRYSAILGHDEVPDFLSE